MAPAPLKFFEMYNLIGDRMSTAKDTRLSPSGYNRELFVAIAWEESFFRNMRQDSGWDVGKSIGFGQVQWVLANALLKTNFKDPIAAVLADNDLSADLMLRAMLEVDRMHTHNKTAAMKSYAGGKTPAWVKTSDALLAIPALAGSGNIDAPTASANQDAITAALSITRNDKIMLPLIF